MRMVRTVHTALAWVLVSVATALLGLLAVVAGAVAPRSDAALRIARLWARSCLLVTGARLKVEGLDHLQPGCHYVVMANHESTLDIPTLLVALPPQLGVRFLAKESLFRVPILGRAMHAMGFVPVNREDGTTAKGMFDRTLDQIRRKRSVLVFPEATRSPDGRLLPFHRGGFLIALKSGLPILPVGLEGPRLAMPDGSHSIRPERLLVRIGEPIDTAGRSISERRQLAALCRAAIDELRGPRGHLPDPPQNGAPLT